MTLSLRSVLPTSSPIAALQSLPVCASPGCPRPPSLWQRWWARHEGIWIHEDWYCSAGCFHAGLYRRLEQAAISGPGATAAANRLPLGLVLLSQGDITPEQLRRALDHQREAGTGRIGEWLVRMGAVSEPQVTAALAVQQGCPVFNLQEPQWLPLRLHWPDALARQYRALPVFHNRAQSLLYVGFLGQVDRSFLLCVEQVLRCRTEPCIVSAATYRQHRELLARFHESRDVEIIERQTSVEMMRTLGNYAEQVHAERCLLARCQDRLWIRFESAREAFLDLLFRMPVPS